MTVTTPDEAAIRAQISQINHAWQHQRGETLTSTLKECFANDIVMRGPGFTFISKGRELAVQSFVDFTAQAEVKAFSAEEPAIDLYGDTATATYAWQMTYVLAGQEYTEQGHDIFIFSRQAGQWLAVWRTLLSS
jgi:hypothetical protein